jgi:hypothetical protein
MASTAAVTHSTHVVTRAFQGPGSRQLAPGSEVDASGWRNADRLVALRYLRPIEQPATPIPTPRPIDEASLVKPIKGRR